MSKICKEMKRENLISKQNETGNRNKQEGEEEMGFL